MRSASRTGKASATAVNRKRGDTPPLGASGGTVRKGPRGRGNDGRADGWQGGGINWQFGANKRVALAKKESKLRLR